MAKAINDDILAGVRELITKITNFEPNSDRFISLEKSILTALKKSDSMYFLNTKDIKRKIDSMSEKFMFHGFFKHADYLKQCHDKYIDLNLSESDLTPRLNIVKFLLCMSQSPTTAFWQNPHDFEFITKVPDHSSVIDWGAYLNEGFGWTPPPDTSFSHSSDEETPQTTPSPCCCIPRPVITEMPQFVPYDFQESRRILLETIQCNFGKPPSDWFNANVGILWEEHLRAQVMNLIPIEPVKIITEYRAMREVLWQLWGPHNSDAFQLSVNEVMPRGNVTISSVRSSTFESFMGVFLPYIEILEEFRCFYKKLESFAPETYNSYASGVKKIIQSIYSELIEIENEVRKQETTMTLLKLAERLEILFKPVFILKQIQDEVIIEKFEQKTQLECALTLLTRLRKSLDFSIDKLEQDIRLTLYLESLSYYFNIINAWLVKNDLVDHSQEFIILNKNTEKTEINFLVQDNVVKYEQDGIIKIICDEVLHIGRDIHLLRLLGKYDVFSKDTATIHEEFVRRFLEQLSIYYDCDIPETCHEIPELQKIDSSFDLNGMGDWTNFVDSSDGFLVKAFEDFYFEKTKNTTSKESLFEKICNITTNLFPLQSLPEKIFKQILKDRFTISGLMVKNLLIENYNLDKQFDFLNHIFLFSDDLIFPFYRRLFEKMNLRHSNWGNSVWLTSHLQDVIMDQYPNFYEDCTVQVNEMWKQCRDSLKACSLLTIQYEIKWPLSIIITEEQIIMYKEIFEIVLKLKWALYTINHLVFGDIESKIKSLNSPVTETTLKRLKYLRFNLINILNSIQHYLFGFVFTKQRIQFELDFEKSNDLKSLITSHEDFVKSIHRSVEEIREKKVDNHGFYTLLKCVKMLKIMWNSVEHATIDNLNNCHEIYKMSFRVVNEIVNPVFVFN